MPLEAYFQISRVAGASFSFDEKHVAFSKASGDRLDDRPDARYSMARPLTAAAFDVRETATGRDALRLARLQVDAIVLDLVLPDVDGYEVLRRLKTDPATMNIR